MIDTKKLRKHLTDLRPHVYWSHDWIIGDALTALDELEGVIKDAQAACNMAGYSCSTPADCINDLARLAVSLGAELDRAKAIPSIETTAAHSL